LWRLHYLPSCHYYSSLALKVSNRWGLSTIQGTKTRSPSRYQKNPLFDIIIKLLHQMDYKRATTGTPGRSTSQQTITVIWKKINHTRSPTKSQPSEDEEMYSDCSSGVEYEISKKQQSKNEEKKQVQPLLTTDEEGSGDSSAANKIENLQITSLANGSARSLDTSCLIKFPPLRSEISETLPLIPQTLAHSPKGNPTRQTPSPSRLANQIKQPTPTPKDGSESKELKHAPSSEIETATNTLKNRRQEPSIDH